MIQSKWVHKEDGGEYSIVNEWYGQVDEGEMGTPIYATFYMVVCPICGKEKEILEIDEGNEDARDYIPT